jgi:O-antigen/teichoic acid export membrane protein
MYSRIKSLGKQSLIFGIGGVLNQFVSVLLVPIYTRYLTPGDYGIVQLLLVTSGFVVIITQLGLASAIFKSSLYDESRSSATIYSTAFYSLGTSALLILAIGIGFARPISSLLFDTPAYARLVWIMFATVALDTAIVVPMARLRIEGRALHYSLVSSSSFFCRLLLNVLFIVVLRRGAAGLIEANALQSLLFIFVYIWLVKDKLELSFSWGEFLDLIGFGLPLVPALIFSRILSMSDRYILNHYTDLAEVGLYSLGYRIASVVYLAVSAFQTAWPAIFFSAGRTEDAKRFYSRVMTYFLFFNGYLALALSVLAEDLLRVMASEVFYPAYKVVPLLSLSYVFYGAYFVANTGIQLKRKTHYVAYIVGIAAALQIGLNLLLIPDMGMIGAALNTAISYLAMPIMVVVVSRRFYYVSYEYKRIGMIFVVITVIYFLSRLIQIENPILSFGLRGLIASAFPLVLAIVGFYTEDEKKRIRQLLRRGWDLASTHSPMRKLV